MSELKLISPLLDNMEILKCVHAGGGASVYLLRSTVNGGSYMLKHISVPESQTQVDALLFTGAASNEAEAQKYYEQIVADYREELEALAALHGSSNCASFLGCQICAKENGIGFEVYLLSEKWTTLTEYLSENAMTHLKALNLGLDLCTALCELRAKGLIHRDIKPENIYLNTLGGFMIGDLGVARIDKLKYCAMPERMVTEYTAPEITDLMCEFNTTIDIYSVGMVLYRILNGNHGPFEDENTSSKAANKLRITGQALPTPLYSDYELAAIVLKACAYDPAERYQTPEEMMQDLVLYMKRNNVTDSLIVPPIVSDADVMVPRESVEEKVEPVRFAKVEEMDEKFVASFSPDTQACGPAEAPPASEPSPAPAAAQDADAPETAAEEAPVPSQGERESPAVPADSGAPQAPAFAAPRTRRIAEDDEPPIPSAPPSASRKQRKPRLWIPIAAAVVLIAIIGVSLYFLAFGGPAVHITGLTVTDRGTDFLTVAVDDGGQNAELTLSCTDTYGNAVTADYTGEPVTFSGLVSGAQYSISAVSRAGKRLSGSTTTMASTIATTEIVSFTAVSTLAGQVELNLMVSGPDPGEWTVRCTADGVEPQEVSFSGHTVSIFNLETDKDYTFELLQPEGIVLSGESKLSFHSGPEITISDLQAASTSRTAIRVTWSCGEDEPEEWSVTCTAPDGTVQTQTVQDCEAEFTELATGQEYTITVTSSGTRTPASISVTPAAASVTSFQAEGQTGGRVRVTWESEDAEAEWIVVYTLQDLSLRSQETVQGSDVTIGGLIPGQTYTIELRSGAGDILDNAGTEVTLPAAEKFDEHGANSFFLGLFYRPEKDDWSRKDLSSSSTEYRASDRIAFAVECLSGIRSSDEETQIAYTVEDADGTILSVRTYSAVWDDMWSSGLFLGELAETPQDPGTYTLRLYFNGASVKAKEFTILE